MTVQCGRVFVRARPIAVWACVLVATVVGGFAASAAEAGIDGHEDTIPESPGTALKTCVQLWDDYWDCMGEVGPDTGRCIMPGCVPTFGPVATR